MNTIFKHIAIAALPAALLMTGFTATAQNYEPGSYKVVGGIAFNKHVSDNGNGTFTVDLESFVTGKVHTETVEVPADIILLMDVSSSMSTYTSTESVTKVRTKTIQSTGIKSQNNRGWTYTNLTYGNTGGQVNYQWYYKHTDGNYYAVRRANNLSNGSGSNNVRAMWVVIDGETKYLSGTELKEDYDHTITSSTTVLWTGPLYKGWTYTNLGVGGTSDASNVANQYYYLHTDGNYYPVRRANNLSNGSGSNNVRAMWVVIDGQRKYLTKDGLQDDYDHTVTGDQISIYFDYLFRGWTSDNITAGTHYYMYEGQLYPLRKQTTGGLYTVYFEPSAGVRYYLTTTGEGISTTPCAYATAGTISLYFGNLYTVGRPTRADGLADAVDAFIVALSNDAKEKGLHHRLAMVEYSRNLWIDGSSNRDNPVLEEGPVTGQSTHVIKGLRDVTDDDQVVELRDAITLPDTFLGYSYMSYGLSIANSLFDEARANPLDEDGDGTVDEYKRPQIALLVCDGGSTDRDEDVLGRALKEKGIIVYIIHVTNSYFAEVRDLMSNAHSELGNGYYTANSNGHHIYNSANRNAGYEWEYISPVDEYDEKLIEALVNITSEIGGAELEVEGTVVTVDVVSQAFNIPTGDDVSAPKVYIAPLTGNNGASWDPTPATTGGDDEFVYYEFGPEVLQGEGSGITLTEGVDEYGNKKLSVEGFDYSAHWCGPDNKSSTGYHQEGQKLILRFTVVPNEDAVGGPEVQTNTDESGIWIPDPDNPDKKIQLAKFNQPTVALPVNLWIKKTGLEGNDNAVFTIYYADPTLPANVGKKPTEMEYKSFTKVVVRSTDGVVKLTGLDSRFYYRVKEDAWSWTYDPEPLELFTSEVLSNPLEFVNTKKETLEQAKQAEAIKRNTFE